jgi:hypothetical protein
MSANAGWLKIHAFRDKNLTQQTLNLQHVRHGIHRVQIGSPKLGRSDRVRHIDIIQMKYCCLLWQRCAGNEYCTKERAASAPDKQFGHFVSFSRFSGPARQGCDRIERSAIANTAIRSFGSSILSDCSHFGGITMRSQTHFRLLSETVTEVVPNLNLSALFQNRIVSVEVGDRVRSAEVPR